MSNRPENAEMEARAAFLRSVRQLGGNALLLQLRDDYRLEPLYVSDAFGAMMECAPEAAAERMRGLGFVEFTHPEDRQLVRGMLKRRRSDDGTDELVLQLITARGRIIWCSVRFRFIDDYGGHFIYCVCHDVSTMMEYESSLRDSYARLGRSFYQLSGRTLAMLRVNLTRDLIEDVKGTDLFDADYVGLSYDASLRARGEQALIEQERTALFKTFSRRALTADYRRGRSSASMVLFSRRRNGRQCYVRYEVSLTRHPLTGELTAFVTEREYNDEKVRETLVDQVLARQFEMVSYLADGRYGVVIGDADRSRRGSIFPMTRTGDYRLYLQNQLLPHLTGSAQQRVEVLRALAPETVTEQSRKSQPYSVDAACETDGVLYHKRFDFYPIDPEARFCLFLESDVTALYREQELRSAQLRAALKEARQANEAKTAFLSSMSHEIRTPMNAIIGLDNIALKEPDLPPKTREQLEKIGGSARHLLGLINDILDMSRIESGSMSLNETEFSLREMLDQINTMIQGQCQDKGLEYRFTAGAELDSRFTGDAMKLKQVLINILGNAVKFTPAPGTVSLAVETAARFADQTTLRFTAADTGIGIDPEYLPRMFDAFSQEDATTTNRYGGSGLGMAISRNLIGMMNGDISVESEKGRGSVFTVTVSLRNAAGTVSPEPAPTEEPARAGLSGRRVLLAEDTALNAEIMLELLDMEEISAEHAENGQAALELFLSRPPGYFDAILMDIRMPVMNGLDASAAIRATERPDAASIPIIAMTANAFDEDVQRSLQAGMDAHLTKPVEPDRLYATLAELISRGKPRKGDDADGT